MKTITAYVSENGTLLANPDDGFIVFGNIYKADNESGLIGNGASPLELHPTNPTAYSNEEFLDAIGIPLDVLQNYIDKKSPKSRCPNQPLPTLIYNHQACDPSPNRSHVVNTDNWVNVPYSTSIKKDQCA